MLFDVVLSAKELLMQHLDIRKHIFVCAMFEYEKETCIYSGGCTIQLHLDYQFLTYSNLQSKRTKKNLHLRSLMIYRLHGH